MMFRYTPIILACLSLVSATTYAQPEAPVPAVITQLVTPAPRFYGSYDVMFWSFRDGNVPNLVTTSNAADAGIIGNPSTTVLFGGDYSLGGRQSGFRATLGAALDPLGATALEWSVLYFAPRNQTAGYFTRGADGVLAIPFNNVTPEGMGGLGFGSATGNQGADAYLIAKPEQFGGEIPGRSGSILIETSSQLWGTELNTVTTSVQAGTFSFGPIFGARYLNLQESLKMTTTTEQPLFGFVRGEEQFGIIGSSKAIFTDSFSTKNQFYGGQIGLRTTATYGRFFMVGNTKLAVGFNHQTAEISGTHTDLEPIFLNTSSSGNTGLLTAKSNIGYFARNQFSIVNEVETILGMNVTDRIVVTVGMQALYMGNVIRPGDLIDRNINLNQIGSTAYTRGESPLNGPASPTYNPLSNGFFASGVSVGIRFQY